MVDTWAEAEAAGARLSDPRRVTTLGGMFSALHAGAGRSWSAALGSGPRQAASDLVKLPGVQPADLLAGHYAATAARCAVHPLVIVSHDTTSYNYTRHRATRGLGALGDGAGGRGIWAHSALALTPAGEPLGLLEVSFWTRPAKRSPKALRPYEQRESYKWQQTVARSAGRLVAGQRAWCVSDRESDVFEYLQMPRPAGVELIVRAVRPRACSDDQARLLGSVLAASAGQPTLATVSVPVAATRTQPARRATLAVRAARVWLHAPQAWPAAKRTRLQVTVVVTDEVDPPVGAKPLHWVLLSTVLAERCEAVLALVAAYQRRWRIETLHETLKQEGLRVERLQLATAYTLTRALAVYHVVAWRLMDLCYAAREQPEQPAGERFDDDELAVLSVLAGHEVVTLGQAVRVLAKLGGWPGYPSSPPYGPPSVRQGAVRLAAMVAYHRRLHGRAGPYDTS